MIGLSYKKLTPSSPNFTVDLACGICYTNVWALGCGQAVKALDSDSRITGSNPVTPAIFIFHLN